MTNGEKHIEKLLSWYKEAVTEDGVCYLTSDDKNTLAYAIKCCKHFEDIKKGIDSWALREEPSGSEKPNKSENPTSSDCVDRHSVDMLAYRYLKEPTDNNMAFYEDFLDLPSVVPIRPKGHWIARKKVGFGEWKDVTVLVNLKGCVTDSCECSECGDWLTGSDEYECSARYCPNCGAEMEEVEE